MARNSFIILLLVFFLAEAAAQKYLPNLISYDKLDYGAGRQNWDVEIGPNGIVYFANTDGLLFNIFGEWGLSPIAPDAELRSLYAEKDTIWAGGVELGFFSRGPGSYVYHTLQEDVGGVIWNIEPLEDQIVFQTENFLHFLDRSSGTISSINYIEGIWALTSWNNKLWMVLRDGQIGFLEEEIFVPVTQSDLFRNREVRKLIVLEDQLVVVMFDGEVHSFDGEMLRAKNLPHELKGSALFTGMPYEEDKYCLGTVSDGFLLMSSSGFLEKQVNTDDGLLDNTVLSMAMDDLGSVWLGLDYGIARVELQSPISSVFQGAAAYSYTKNNTTRFLATAKGLFVSELDGNYNLVPELEGQAWKVRKFGQELFICHTSGLYRRESNAYRLMADFSGFMDLARFGDSNYYIAATYHGLVLVGKWGNEILHQTNLNLWGNTSLVWDAENECIWAGFKEGPVHKINLNKYNQAVAEPVDNYKAVFDTRAGIFILEGGKLISPDNFAGSSILLEDLNPDRIRTIEFSPDGNAMACIDDKGLHLKIILPDGNSYSYDALLASQSGKLIPGYETLDLEQDRLLFCTDRGLSVFDLGYKSRFRKYSAPCITSMEILNEEGQKYYFPYPDEMLSLEAGNKDLLFRLGLNRNSNDVAEFRSMLEGRDKNWSSWSSTETALLFPQVRGGNYRLRVQARINSGEPEDVSLEFQIAKLWYQTGLLALPIVLLVLLWMSAIVLYMSRRSRRKLATQKKEFSEKNARRTLDLKNEQLLQYIEIISHKNEFLNKLSGGLEKMRNTEAQQWVNRISEEVNNEKKEFLFHKLFSEVHQDFLARLGERYPDLTSNDLRMLTFIRVNLDKREICNLMNISQRSLDTNRYRLRKKLSLPHETDLDQFVRDF